MNPYIFLIYLLIICSCAKRLKLLEFLKFDGVIHNNRIQFYQLDPSIKACFESPTEFGVLPRYDNSYRSHHVFYENGRYSHGGCTAARRALVNSPSRNQPAPRARRTLAPLQTTID